VLIAKPPKHSFILLAPSDRVVRSTGWQAAILSLSSGVRHSRFGLTLPLVWFQKELMQLNWNHFAYQQRRKWQRCTLTVQLAQITRQCLRFIITIPRRRDWITVMVIMDYSTHYYICTCGKFDRCAHSVNKLKTMCCTLCVPRLFWNDQRDVGQ
jgi:hypothetical protein